MIVKCCSLNRVLCCTVTCLETCPALATNRNLQVYLHRSGFARFTNAHFSMKKEDMVNNYVHLTNSAIQKTDPSYDSVNGTKW